MSHPTKHRGRDPTVTANHTAESLPTAAQLEVKEGSHVQCQPEHLPPTPSQKIVDKESNLPVQPTLVGSGVGETKMVTLPPSVGELCHNLQSSRMNRVFDALVAIRKKHLATPEDITAFRRRDGKRKKNNGKE